jgi:ech hydrogenase subunit E
MAQRTVIPFGPQHPVLPEPIHLDLVMEDETVVEAIPSFGFIHRGLEKLAEKKDFTDFTFVAERICGICSYTHGHGYCEAIESVLGLQVPPRAQFLRTMWGELSRIHSHMMWLGLLADAFGFENLFMACWRLREGVLDVIEETTGGRVIFGAAKVGGCRRDVAEDLLKRIPGQLDAVEKQLHAITDVFRDDYSVRQRLCGVGVLSAREAFDLGAVGPMIRASGVSTDSRLEGYAAYGDLQFEPVVEKDGDCWARTMVRIREIYQAFDLIRQIIPKVPGGPVEVKVTGTPNGEFFSRLEQPRGEVIYYVKGSGKKTLDRFRVRTPTFANIPPLLKMLQGCQLADVPVIVLTIDPCISCAER